LKFGIEDRNIRTSLLTTAFWEIITTDAKWEERKTPPMQIQLHFVPIFTQI